MAAFMAHCATEAAVVAMLNPCNADNDGADGRSDP